MTVRVSVVMSVYNGAATLRDAVGSVLAQTFQDFEFIVVDDGSADGTAGILASCRDPRLRVIRQENAGLTVSLNRGTREARGDLIARMDADDVSLPGRLGAQVRVFDRDADAVLVGTDAERIEESGRVIGHLRHQVQDHRIRKVLPVGNQFVHGSVMFRRDAFEKAGRYDERIRYSQDFNLWWRMANEGLVGNVPETAYRLRESKGRISARHSGEQDRYRDDIIRRIWREILAPGSGFPPEERPREIRSLRGADPRSSERTRSYARLLLRMGIGYSLHGRKREARRYFEESVLADPRVKEAWGCLLLNRVRPGLLKRRCLERATELGLYRTIESASGEGERGGEQGIDSNTP